MVKNISIMKKIIMSVPAFAAVASFAETSSTGWTPSQGDVASATDNLVTWGGLIIGGIGGVIAVAAGLRLLVKGVNRAVGK